MRRLIQKTKLALRRLLRKNPEAPGDPYAWVGAPRKPRPPLRSSAVALEEPD
ncbi:MAG TPA: hypothetical protein VGL72_03355 [Bryobacteraceae bacterium]|jgi:hypothetical protein